MKSVCKVYRSMGKKTRYAPTMPWVCERPDGIIHCRIRAHARQLARIYNRERAALLREGMKVQGRIEFYEGH